MAKLHKSIISKLRNIVDVQLLLDRYGVEYRHYGGDSYRGSCPIHGGDNPTGFVFSDETKTFICFTQGCKGDVFDFVEKMEGCNFARAIEIIADIAGFDISIEGIQEGDALNIRYESFADVVNKSMNKLRSNDNDEVNKPIDDYILKRLQKYIPSTKYLVKWKSIDYGLQKDFGIGFGILPNDPCHTMRITVPIYDEVDRCVGIQGRSWKPGIDEKYCNYPTGIKKDKIVFNLNRIKDYLEDDDVIFVTEGIFDTMMLWKYMIRTAVCVFGSKPSEYQINLMNKYSNNFVLCFDNDVAGVDGINRFLKIAMELNLNVSILPIPKDKNDLGEMNLEEIENALLSLMTPKEWLGVLKNEV